MGRKGYSDRKGCSDQDLVLGWRPGHQETRHMESNAYSIFKNISPTHFIPYDTRRCLQHHPGQNIVSSFRLICQTTQMVYFYFSLHHAKTWMMSAISSFELDLKFMNNIDKL